MVLLPFVFPPAKQSDCKKRSIENRTRQVHDDLRRCLGSRPWSIVVLHVEHALPRALPYLFVRRVEQALPHFPQIHARMHFGDESNPIRGQLFGSRGELFLFSLFVAFAFVARRSPVPMGLFAPGTRGTGHLSVRLADRASRSRRRGQCSGCSARAVRRSTVPFERFRAVAVHSRASVHSSAQDRTRPGFRGRVTLPARRRAARRANWMAVRTLLFTALHEAFRRTSGRGR